MSFEMVRMEIFKQIETIDGLPGILVKNLNAIAIADIHLGYELALAEKGVFVPQTQLKEVLKELKEIFQNVEAKNLIIVGDVKHEFGEASAQEWREVKELVNYIKKEVEKIILVRGNHDNYLLNICSKLGIKVYDPYYFSKKICFIHGHRRVKIPTEAETIVIAHEHPALVLREGFSKIKVRCLLYGKTKNKKNFICLPAISFWAQGTDVNLISPNDLLSPILKEEVEFEKLIPIALDKEIEPLRFPELRNFLSE